MNKRVYFVRHGTTVANLADTFQGLDDPLSPEGETQAIALGERFANVSFDVIIASDALRTQDTATAIAKRTGHSIETSPLFREWSRPSSLIGIARTDPRSAPYLTGADANGEDAHWHYEDEENLFDVRERALRALALLEKRTEKTMLVVTHGNFKRVLLGVMLFKRDLTYAQWLRIRKCFLPSNTGVTVANESKGEWKILTWNDYAHLAE